MYTCEGRGKRDERDGRKKKNFVGDFGRTTRKKGEIGHLRSEMLLRVARCLGSLLLFFFRFLLEFLFFLALHLGVASFTGFQRFRKGKRFQFG